MAKEREEMLSMGEYTIGTYNGCPPKRDDTYSYIINNHEYHCMDGVCHRFMPQDFEPEDHVGEKFLVLYSKDDPGHSYLCFEYPIKAPEDFSRYSKELKMRSK